MQWLYLNIDVYGFEPDTFASAVQLKRGVDFFRVPLLLICSGFEIGKDIELTFIPSSTNIDQCIDVRFRICRKINDNITTGRRKRAASFSAWAKFRADIATGCTCFDRSG